jgi:hypothetical protein
MFTWRHRRSKRGSQSDANYRFSESDVNNDDINEQEEHDDITIPQSHPQRPSRLKKRSVFTEPIEFTMKRGVTFANGQGILFVFF